MTRDQLRQRALAMLKRKHLSIRQYARLHGTDQSHLSKFLRNGEKPSPSVVTALGYRLKDDAYTKI